MSTPEYIEPEVSRMMENEFSCEEPTKPYPARETMAEAVTWWRNLWEKLEQD